MATADGFASIFRYDSAFVYNTNEEATADGWMARYRSDLSAGRSHLAGEVVIGSGEESRMVRWIRTGITTLLYGTLVVAFPVLGWFCIKRVPPLERAVVYRLGQRLPIRGPGLMVTFPGVDDIHMIDTRRQSFKLIGGEEESEENTFITSDKSIVRLNVSRVVATLEMVDPIMSCTQLADPRENCKRFARVTFKNAIHAAHVDDLEERIYEVMDKFLASSNQTLKTWGWELVVENLPEVSVIERANPVHPVLDALKCCISGGGGSSSGGINPLMAFSSQLISSMMPNATNTPATCTTSPSELFESSLESSAETSQSTSQTSDLTSNEDDIALLLQEMLSSYSCLLTGDLRVSLQMTGQSADNNDDLQHTNSIRHFEYTKATRTVRELLAPPADIQAVIKCTDIAKLKRSIKERDTSLVTIEYC